jgi:hypothetical protein
MREIVFFLEEESAKAMLECVVRSLLSGDAALPIRYIVFEGKQDLERQLAGKLRGYLNPKAHFIVLRDQDRQDCHKVKRTLRKLCTDAARPHAVVRIACRELESFYLGDLRAVEAGLGIHGLAAKQNRAKYRDPDHLQSPALELEQLTDYRYQKVAGSRAIAPHLDLVNPRSRSFRCLIQAIRDAAQTSPPLARVRRR